MDWNAAIEKNREALKRVVAMLVAMAGLDSGDSRGPFAFFRQKGCSGEEVARAEKGGLSPALAPALTLPRHLHRAVVELLHPAEAAVRRLIIVAARGLVVTLPPPRKLEPKPKTMEPLLRSLGIAVTMSRADLEAAAAATRRAAARGAPARSRSPSLPLFDPLRHPFRGYRRHVPAHAAPRISGLGFDAPFRPLPAPPSPDDPIDATRLASRLEALVSALDDLPGQARRFARWRARRDAAAAQEREGRGAGVQGREARRTARFRRIRPLRTGRPPGWRRKTDHEVHEILDVVHGLAFWALESPDTS